MIELGFLKRYESIRKLIDFGSNGYFPLFDGELTHTDFIQLRMNKGDRLKAKSLLKKISTYNTLEKQKVLFSSFSSIDRAIVAKAIIELIEGKLLDTNPQIQ